jgi:ribosomal protein S18 acetylase RimI-like enzyme
MDGRLSIRPATLHDDDALLRLDVIEPGTGFPSVAARQRSSFFGANDPSQTLVAEVDGTVVGYLSLRHPTPLPENAHVFSVEGFTVEPAHRGRGIGRALLDAAAAHARARGGTKLSLRVLGSNPRARRVYEAAGFAVEGVLAGEFVIDGSPTDDVIMGRRL